MIPILILSACVPAVPAGPRPLPNLQVQQSPTLVASTTATQSTESEPQVAPAVPLFEVRLSVLRPSAKVSRIGSITDVQQAQSVNIQVDDGIEVVKLEEQDEQSYSVLDFADYLEVELFSNTSVFLADLRQGAGDATHVTLHLDRGIMFVHQNEQKSSQVTIQTLFTTIKTLTSGTEFDVCHNEELTCVVVKKGVVEVTAKGRKIIVKAGEAGYVLKDESPSATICAPNAVFIVWEERFRLFADAPALDQELSLLPQKPCPVTSADLPLNARILYRDEFRNPSNGWVQGEIDNFMVSYFRLEGRRTYRYYQVQVQGPNDQYLAFIPNEREYSDVNVDIKAFSEAPSSGDFRYGMIFRRSGDQYYAFVISPLTKSWYFLKSSSAGLEILREGIDERMRALEARDTLRVESYGSTFLLFINGRFIDLVSDPDYASGEVGLFVETMDNPDALIRFDSLIIWDMPPVTLIPDTGGREYCFNTFDDNGNGLIDRADPDCQRLGLTSTSFPLPTNTSIAPETSTPQPTNTSIVPKTFTSQPTRTLVPLRTSTPQPTRTRTPIPPRTSTPQSTRTRTPIPLRTSTLQPTRTRTPIPPRTSTLQPTRTLIPQPTRTPIPQPTRTLIPQPTRTPIPQPTRTLIPQPTRTPVPQPTRTLIPQPTRTPIPLPTRTPIPPRTSTPQPTRTLIPPTNPPPTATNRPPPTATDAPPPTATDPPPTEPPPPTATDPPPTEPPPPTATDPPPTDPPPPTATDPPTPEPPPPTDPPPPEPPPTEPPIP